MEEIPNLQILEPRGFPAREATGDTVSEIRDRPHEDQGLRRQKFFRQLHPQMYRGARWGVRFAGEFVPRRDEGFTIDEKAIADPVIDVGAFQHLLQSLLRSTYAAVGAGPTSPEVDLV